jgi:hypothetical protein
MFPNMTTPFLASTQPSIQLILGDPSLRVKWPGRETDHSQLFSYLMSAAIPTFPLYAVIVYVGET